ncbi:MAG TPA: CAP domain-containing protein, partial [Pyrodictium sp.]|nr:CAP domain-containing protein [Pyrodictium sp.]
MKKVIFGTVLSLGLIGCGGGSPSNSGTNTDNDVLVPEIITAKYKACIPLKDSPSTFNCVETCEAEELSVGTSDSLSSCESFAQKWLDDFNHEDEPRTALQQEGLDWLNKIRRGAGLPIFKHNAKLETATASHENYLGDTDETYGVSLAHKEDNVNYFSAYYTGVSPKDRAKYAGYEDYYVAEVISYIEGDVVDSIDNLMLAIYHRQGILLPTLDEVGLGGVENNYIAKKQPHLLASKETRRDFLRAVSKKL